MKHDAPAFIALAAGTALAVFGFCVIPPGKEREVCALAAMTLIAFYLGWRLRSRKGGE